MESPTNCGLKGLIRCFVDRNGTHPYRIDYSRPIRALHQMARDEKHRFNRNQYGGSEPGPWLGKILQIILWPAIVLYDSTGQFFHPEKDFNRGIHHFFWDMPRMIWLALRYNLSPVHFYMYHLHTGSLHQDYVRRFYTAWEFHFLGRRMARLKGHDVGMLDNKDRFYEFCLTHDLPTIPVLDLSQRRTRETLEPRDLFSKSALDFGGEGCHVHEYDAGQKGWRVDGIVVSAGGLEKALEALFEGDRYVLEYRLHNHPEILWLSRNVLTTIRIITAWNRDGEVDLLRATIRIPSSWEAILDNSCQGGISAPVNPKTGEIIGPANSWLLDYKTEFPLDSEQSILGYILPYWEDVTDAVQRGHRAAETFNFLGWDVAISEKGVLLSECNVWSDIELVQAPQNTPFLTDDIVDYFLLEKCLWEKPDSSRSHE